MRTYISKYLQLVALILLINYPTVLQADTPPPLSPQTYSVAVIGLESGSKELEEITGKVNELLLGFLTAQPTIVLVERKELDKILSEQELGLSGTVDPATAAKIGHLTGAKVLITGRAFAVNNDLFLVAKIFGTETSRIFGETVTTKLSDPLPIAVQQLAEKVGNTIIINGKNLVAAAETENNNIEQLQKMVQGKKLPSLSVSVAERSVSGGATLDPAAQTEVTLVLQQLGFRIIDTTKTGEKPDIEVSGEALSEFGMRRGNIVSTKGRVELKAVNNRTGTLLSSDRQTEVAVDLTVEIAGKAAIEKAAHKLAERLVPKLVAFGSN